LTGPDPATGGSATGSRVSRGASRLDSSLEEGCGRAVVVGAALRSGRDTWVRPSGLTVFSGAGLTDSRRSVGGLVAAFVSGFGEGAAGDETTASVSATGFNVSSGLVKVSAGGADADTATGSVPALCRTAT
jgi:hypothetical protein